MIYMSCTVLDITKQLNINIIAGEGGLNNIITGVYICDLLSWVIGKAKKGDAWLTIWGHVNIIAVACLVGLSCVIVCESAEIYKDTIYRANTENIPLLASRLNTYELAKGFISFEKQGFNGRHYG